MGESEQDQERRPTERVILKAERVVVLPAGAQPDQIAVAVEALYPKAKRAEREASIADAWLEVARHTAATKSAAVEAHAGKPGTPDAKLGTFRAPTLTAWKDAVVHDAPPLPLVQRSVID